MDEITRESLAGAKLHETMHLNGGSWFGYAYVCDRFPRLSRVDRYVKKTRSSTQTWAVDGIEVADLDAAVAALNVPPIFDLEELAMLAELPDEPTDLRKTHAMSEICRRVVAKGAAAWADRKISRTDAGRAAIAGKPPAA